MKKYGAVSLVSLLSLFVGYWAGLSDRIDFDFGTGLSKLGERLGGLGGMIILVVVIATVIIILFFAYSALTTNDVSNKGARLMVLALVMLLILSALFGKSLFGLASGAFTLGGLFAVAIAVGIMAVSCLIFGLINRTERK